MNTPLLDVQQLTVRFGGVTAVDRVDLSVPTGSVFAVIGPNGAGKTTLFNAIAGVADPSDGTVLFAGRALEQRPTRRSFLRWTLAALACGVALLLVAANPDALWAAAVRGNYVDRRSGFSLSDAARDVHDHLAGAPAIERRAGRYYVASPDGQLPFGSSPTKAEARARRADLLAMGAHGSGAIETRDGQFVVTDTRGAHVLDTAPTLAELAHRVHAAQALVTARSRARTLHVLAFVCGIALGLVSAWVIARRARRTPSQIARRGIARTFQNIRLFREMSVIENLLAVMRPPLPASWKVHLVPIAGLVSLVVAGISIRAGLLPEIARFGLVLAGLAALAAYVLGAFRRGAFGRSSLAAERAALGEARELLSFVGLSDRAEELARKLPYGDQRRLEIARALATKPRLLLLDEPAAGMNPSESLSLMQTIREIRERGVTVLLIEHHMRVVMGISDRIAVLQYGRKIAEGSPREVRENPAVVEAYLGRQEHAA